MAALAPCEGGSHCPWIGEATHQAEASHPCPEGTRCRNLMNATHLQRFTHKPGAPPVAAHPPPATHVPRTTHRGVRCDNCAMNPVRGFRFKCVFHGSTSLLVDVGMWV